MIICVDFDGTVVTHEFPEVGQDVGAVPVLKRLVASGHKLILWTMRDNAGGRSESPEIHSANGAFLDDALDWFESNGIELYAHQRNPEQDAWTASPKAYAQLYIDDAALGCPLVHPEIGRPYADWKAIECLLEKAGLFNE